MGGDRGICDQYYNAYVGFRQASYQQQEAHSVTYHTLVGQMMLAGSRCRGEIFNTFILYLDRK